eukprot:m51a1_g11697 putative zz-type zinc finger-containing protein (582) ;mRNA; f:29068-31064
MSNIRSLRDLNGDGGDDPRRAPPPPSQPAAQPGQPQGQQGNLLGGLFNFFGNPVPAPGAAPQASPPAGRGPGGARAGMGGIGGGHGRVKSVNEAQMKSELSNAGPKLVVVDYNATWCGPCRQIAPVVEQLAERYPNVVFLSVDIDQNQGLASEAGISGVPTFQFYRNGRVFEQFSGANPQKLQKIVQDNADAPGVSPSTSPSGFSGTGHRLGSEPGAATEQPQQAQQPQGAGSTAQQPQVIADDEGDVFLAEMLSMGFEEAVSRRALAATRNTSLDAAIDWITEHQDDTSSHAAVPAAAPDAAPSEPSAPAPAAEAMHVDSPAPAVHNAICNACSKQIVGKRFKCKTCPDYDMCEACRAAPGSHDAAHEFDEVAVDAVLTMTPEEIALYQKRAKEALAQRRAKQAAEEERANVQRELSRRHTGQEMAESKERIREAQMKRQEAEAKREREEAKAARDRVLKQIEQDKLERAARRHGASSGSTSPAPAAAPAAPVAQRVYTEATLQLRLPDGSTLRHTFKADETIADVYKHAVSVSEGKLVAGTFSLAVPMPRRVFTAADSSLTLSAAGLVPNASLVVSRTV